MKFKYFGIITLLINYLTLFLVPYCLGYYIYENSDALSHLGEIKKITETGYTYPYNIYPATHILLAIVSILSTIRPNAASLIMPAFFSILFVIGMFCYSRIHLNDDINKISLVVPSILIYYLGYYHFQVIPNYFFFALVPIILFSISRYYRSRSSQLSIILIILMIAIVFGHPFVSLFLIYILICNFLINIIFKDNYNIDGYNKGYSLITISILAFLSWFIYNITFLKTFRQLVLAFEQGMTISVADQGANQLSKVAFSPIEFIKFLFIFYGRYIIPLFVILIFIIYVYKFKNSFKEVEFRNIKNLILTLMVFGSYEVILLFNSFLSHSTQRIPDLNFILYAMIPLFTLAIYKLIFTNKYMCNKEVITSVILSVIFLCSVYGAFYSPYIIHPNVAVTYNEVAGMSWLFTYKDTSPIFSPLGEMGIRYADLLLGWSGKNSRKNIDINIGSKSRVPDHFGYDRYTHIVDYNRYIVISTEGKLIYQTVYKIVNRFNETDFSKLENDPKVDKIYDSLNIDLYKA